MPKIQQTNKGQFTLTLPKDLVKSMGWDKGTSLGVFPNGKGAKLTELKKRGKGGCGA